MKTTRMMWLTLLCMMIVLALCPMAMAQESVVIAVPIADDLQGEHGSAYEAAGYKVTFAYENDDPAIEKVEVFSQASMQFLDPIEVGNYIITGQTAAKTYSAYEYE